MRRFFVSQIDPGGGEVVITGSEARHIIRVLRMERGDEIIIIDEQGRRFKATISDLGSKEVRAKIEYQLPEITPSPVRIVLSQALIRSKNMDLVIQKCTELGVNAIMPFVSQRVVVKPHKRGYQKKLEHWRQISINAVKQSDAIRPPEISRIMEFKDMIDGLKKEVATKVILWEQEEGISLKEVLCSESGNKDYFIGIVGPEGGFSKQEIEYAKNAGFVPVTLGKRILRTETASIAFVSLVQYQWGDLN